MRVGEGLAAADETDETAGVGASGSNADGDSADTGTAALMVGLEDGWVGGSRMESAWASTETGNTEGTIRARKNAEASIALRMARSLSVPVFSNTGAEKKSSYRTYLESTHPESWNEECVRESLPHFPSAI